MEDETLWFDRAHLPRDPVPAPMVVDDAPAERIEEPLNSISFFWAMLMICAKKDIYRAPAAAAMPLLPHVIAALQHVQGLMGLTVSAAPTVEPPGSTTAKLAALRALGHQMEAAMRHAADRGLAVPEPVAPAARRYLDFVEKLLPWPDRPSSG